MLWVLKRTVSFLRRFFGVPTTYALANESENNHKFTHKNRLSGHMFIHF